MDRGTVSGFSIRSGYARFPEKGGGVRLEYASDQDAEISLNVITDCVAYDNGGGIAAAWPGENGIRVIRDNIVTHNWAWAGGGMSVIGSIVVNNVISSNEVGYYGTNPHGGGIVAGARAVIRDNLIIGNYSDEWAGGVLATDDVIVENNLIADNECFFLGGGVWGEQDVTIRNNTIVGNSIVLSADGGGGVVAFIRTRVLGNTIVGNSAPRYGGNVLAEQDSTVFGNIIAFSAMGEGFYTRGRAVGDYNCVFGNVGGDYREGREPGEHDINADPLFMDALGADGIPWTEDDNLRLTPDSPCINTGDPDYVPAEDETDLDGHARILCDRVDIGAYEFGIGDYDCDRDVDVFDYEQWLTCFTGPDNPPYAPGCEAFDFDGDLDVDFADFGGFLLALTGG
ncbi:MAG: hypothetical protein IID39_03470 [Planctomycetes bacterium]|nr:hypothetical protein [Planctomycetota bacterium]